MLNIKYADTPIGHAVLANVAAGALIHFFPTNAKVQAAAGAMIESAMVTFASSFNIEDMVDELLEGVVLPEVDLDPIKNKFTGVRLNADENSESA